LHRQVLRDVELAFVDLDDDERTARLIAFQRALDDAGRAT
jgi:hypothetical protein